MESETFFDDIERERRAADAVSYAQQAITNLSLGDIIERHPGWSDEAIAEHASAALRQPITVERVVAIREKAADR